MTTRAEFGPRALDERRVSGDGDRLLQRCDAHRDVHVDRGADGHGHLRPQHVGKARQFRLDRVLARLQRRDAIAPFAVGDHRAALRRRKVRHRDRHAGQRGTLFVGRRARHRAGIDLRPGGGRPEQHGSHCEGDRPPTEVSSLDTLHDTSPLAADRQFTPTRRQWRAASKLQTTNHPEYNAATITNRAGLLRSGWPSDFCSATGPA